MTSGVKLYIIYKIPGYVTRFYSKKQYLSLAVSTDSLGRGGGVGKEEYGEGRDEGGAGVQTLP